MKKEIWQTFYISSFYIHLFAKGHDWYAEVRLKEMKKKEPPRNDFIIHIFAYL